MRTSSRDPKLLRIDFEVEGARISGDRLRQVAQAIEDKRITLEIKAGGGLLSAAYTPHFNRMTLGSTDVVNKSTGKSGVVHESCHALVDLFECKELTELSDEVCAYLAETLYLRAIGAWVSGGSAEMAIYHEADKVAKAKKLNTKMGVKLAAGDYTKLRAAIHAHPAYSGIDDKAKVSGLGVPGKK